MTRLLSLAILFTWSLEALACNIPVFRYALERWQSDSYEITCFYDQLSAEEESFIAGLEALSQDQNGPVNAVVVRSKVNDVKNGNITEVVLPESISKATEIKLPYVVVRSRAGQGRAIRPWHGTLEEARHIGLFESPIRKELIRRLQNGHSIVWLLLRSDDTQRTMEASELLKSQCEALATRIKLPEGIGLPGSELHSEVPLFVKFSYLEIDPDDQREQFLVRLFQGFHPEGTMDHLPLMVPVFGRGRALEVIPATEVTPELMEDLTLFLGGACSCQVKERNPGFDLLLSTDWDRELFGENGLRPPVTKPVTDRERPPVLLSIPPGKTK